jgi:hypothetical protein
MSGGVPICSINSASVLVKVNTISAGSLAITGSTSETICYNTSPSDISFDVAPVAYGGAGTVSYTWYRSDRNATDTGWLAWTEIAGVDSPTLSSATISDLTVSTRFYATVSSTVDTKECTANTNEIIVEVIDEISNPNFSVPATGTVSVCYGESPGPLTFTNADTGGPFISGLGTTFSYSNQWFSSTVSGGPYTTEIAGATALSYTPPALTSNAYYVLRTTYIDNNGLSCTSTSTRMISVLIDDLPSAPGVTISMPGTTTPTLVAQNQVNRITIGGAPAAAEEYYAVVNGILNTFTAADGNVSNIATGLAAEIDNDANISAVANGVGGAGTIEVTGDNPGSVVTISVSRSSGAGGLITSQLITGSQVITLCSGELTSATATLTARATDADTYEFFVDGVDQNNGGGDKFQLPSNLATSTLITIQAWDATTSSCYIEYGVNIEQNVIGSGQISGTQVICSNSSPTILGSLTAATVQPGATLEYYWYSDSDLDGNFDLIPAGPHGASYQPGTLTTSTTFYRVARSTWNGNICEETSNTVTVTVADALTAGTATTTIGSALGDNVICSGDIELDIEIDSGEAAAPDIRFIWQTSPDDANWTDTAQTNETFTRGQALFADTYYRRVAQRMSGGVLICSINSASVLVKVNTISAGSLAIAGSTSETICYNTSPSDISFDVAPVAYGGAGTVSYTWYKSDRNATDTGWLAWTEIAGVDSPTLSSATISDLTVSTRFYATVSSTVDTKECTANTNEIVVEVIDEISNPNFSVPATGTVSVCYGESPGPLSFTDASSNAGVSLLGYNYGHSYQWFSSVVSGGPYTRVVGGTSTSTSYTPPPLTSDVYYVLRTTYTDNNGLSCTSTSTRMISVLIDDFPTIPSVTISGGGRQHLL